MEFKAKWLEMLADIEHATGAEGLDRLESLTEAALSGRPGARLQWQDFDRMLLDAGFDRGNRSCLEDLRSSLTLKAVQRIESEAVLSRQRLFARSRRAE
jgi:hypothetical protein